MKFGNKARQGSQTFKQRIVTLKNANAKWKGKTLDICINLSELEE